MTETPAEFFARRAAEKAEREARIARRDEIAAAEYARFKAEGRVVKTRAEASTHGKMTVAEAKSLAASIAIMRAYEEARRDRP